MIAEITAIASLRVSQKSGELKQTSNHKPSRNKATMKATTAAINTGPEAEHPAAM